MSQALGRGLSSLIPQKNNRLNIESGVSDDDKKRITEIDPNLIVFNPYQPRRQFKPEQLHELADTIRQYGLIQPLVVTLNKNNKYELIAGERRLRASIMIGLKKVPVILREATNKEKLELALIENIQRAELNAIETALAYRQLIDEFGFNQEELAKKIGRSRPAITNALRLLNLPKRLREAVIKGDLSEGHAIVIAGLDSEEKQLALFKKITTEKLTVSGTTKEVRKAGNNKARVKFNPQDQVREVKIKERFNLKSEIIRNRFGGGKVILWFENEEGLDRLIK